MSEMNFQLSLYSEGHKAAASWFGALSTLGNRPSNEEKERALQTLAAAGLDQSALAVLKQHQLDVVPGDEGTLELEMGTGSGVPVSFFEDFVDWLEDQDVPRFHAQLFDSSSGGMRVWRRPELDLDVEDMRLLLIGDLDEDDREELEEMLEDQEGMLVDSLNECNLVAVADNPDELALDQIKKKQLPLVTYDEIMAYLMQF